MLGGGNPAMWPAAKPVPPSLKATYGTNLKAAFLALINYWDWLGSHPNPDLVDNVVADRSNIFLPQEYLMAAMRHRAWHLPPEPTQIQFLYVPPQSVVTHNYRLPASVTVYAVINQVTEPYLNVYNKVVGTTEKGIGLTLWKIGLVRPVGQHFKIGVYEEIDLKHGLRAWEMSVSKP